jgi:bifunctional polynucleotide phosphatase/kinase
MKSWHLLPLNLSLLHQIPSNTIKHPQDFSDSDYKLAVNLKIPFATPEKFFLRSTQPLHTILPLHGIVLNNMPHVLNPDVFAPSPSSSSGDAFAENGEGVELVLLVAPQACGKSTMARKFEALGYVRVNQDTLKTYEKCAMAALEALRSGKSVVVDNTNCVLPTREKWVELSKSVGATVRCVNFAITREVADSLERLRMLSPATLPEDRREISSIALATMFKHQRENPPSMAEGALMCCVY